MQRLTDGVDPPDNLVAGHERQRGLAEIAIDDVQVGAAHAAGPDPDSQLPGAGLGHGQIDRPQRGPDALEDHRPHAPGAPFSSTPSVSSV